jgi:hypothetical protein
MFFYMFNDLHERNRQKKECCVVQRNHSNLGVIFVTKSLHKGISSIGKYPMWVGFILVTQRLVLCNSGTLGKGTLQCTHPWVFQHTLSECWVFLPMVNTSGNLLCASTMVVLQRDATRHGVYFDNRPDFLVLGAIWGHRSLVTPCHLRRKNLTSIDRERCIFTVLFVIPTAIALSQCTGIFGWGWPRSANVWQNIIPSWQLWKRVLSSASAADATMNLIIVVFV